MDQITVLIADDHVLFREGLAMLLGQQDDIRVVGEAADGAQALRMTETLQPDILLLDVRMPGLSGLDILSTILTKSPGTKVLILSGFFEEELIIEALQHGAKGYLQKVVTFKEVVRAIRATHGGELWAKRRVLAQVLEILLEKVHDLDWSLPELQKTLTNREQEIAKWVIQGMTNKEIATQLCISENTVKTHLSNMFCKLKVSRRLQLLLHQIVDHTD